MERLDSDLTPVQVAVPLSLASTMTSFPLAKTATYYQYTSSALQAKPRIADTDTIPASSSYIHPFPTESHNAQPGNNRVTPSSLVHTALVKNPVGENVTLLPTRRIAVTFTVEALPGPIGLHVKIDGQNGFKILDMYENSQLMGIVKKGDLLLSIDGLRLQGLKVDQLLQYLSARIDSSKTFKVKRKVGPAPASASDMLAHAAEDARNETLDEVGDDWQQHSFDQRIADLKKFKEKYGHCYLHSRSKINKSLGVWSSNIRSAYNGTGTKWRLNKSMIRRLEEIGFEWFLSSKQCNHTAEVGGERKTLFWTDNSSADFNNSQIKKRANSHMEETLQSGRGGNTNGLTVSQNDEASTSSSDPDKRKHKQPMSFDQRIVDLKMFKENYGHCDIRSNSTSYKSLGKWSHDVRSSHRGMGSMKLTADQVRRLEEIGFNWVLPTVNAIQSVNDSATKEQYDKHKYKPKTNSVIIDQWKSMKRQRQNEKESQARKKMVQSKSPGSPSFDPSRYTHEELMDAMEESKRVCEEMGRREAARLDEIASRLFASDESDENSG